MKRAGVLGLAIVLVLALAIGAAEAKKKKVRVGTAATIEYADGTFSGVVKSPKPRCRRNRTIEVLYEDGKTVGSATSDGGGAWELDPAGKLVIGDYRASVAKRRIEKRRKITICKAGVSPDLYLGP